MTLTERAEALLAASVETTPSTPRAELMRLLTEYRALLVEFLDGEARARQTLHEAISAYAATLMGGAHDAT